MYVCMYVCMYVSMYVCTYLFTQIHVYARDKIIYNAVMRSI